MGKREETRQHIINISETLFSQSGYDNVSVQEICHAAGITKTTFYYHFSSKESLLEHYLSAMESYEPTDLQLLLALDSSWKQFFFLADISVRRYLQRTYPFLGQLLKISVDGEFDFFSSLNDTVYQNSAVLLAKMQQNHEMNNRSVPKHLTDLSVMLTRALCFNWCRSKGTIDFRQEYLSCHEYLFDVLPEYRFSLEEFDAEISSLRKKFI